MLQFLSGSPQFRPEMCCCLHGVTVVGLRVTEPNESPSCKTSAAGLSCFMGKYLAQNRIIISELLLESLRDQPIHGYAV